LLKAEIGATSQVVPVERPNARNEIAIGNDETRLRVATVGSFPNERHDANVAMTLRLFATLSQSCDQLTRVSVSFAVRVTIVLTVPWRTRAI